MGTVVVLVVTGLFVLLPLWFAWLSTDSRRWQRVERLLGREPTSKEPPSWVWWAWIGLSAAYVVIGALRVASGRERFLGVVWLFQGVLWGLLAGSWYLRWRREREQASPGADSAQVEGGPKGPRPGETP
jgi:4-amino-4-deoxy-L-arabinose transferase-like glycosyltransferase